MLYFSSIERGATWPPRASTSAKMICFAKDAPRAASARSLFSAVGSQMDGPCTASLEASMLRTLWCPYPRDIFGSVAINLAPSRCPAPQPPQARRHLCRSPSQLGTKPADGAIWEGCLVLLSHPTHLLSHSSLTRLTSSLTPVVQSREGLLVWQHPWRSGLRLGRLLRRY
jgi:hypothetical protein